MTLPPGWAPVTLGEICELKYGKGLTGAARHGAGFPVYGSNGVVGENHAPFTVGPTVIVGRKGSFGEVHYSPTACWPIDTTYFVDSGSTACDLRWLSHRVAGLGLKGLNKSAAIPGLNREDAYRQRLLLPPPDEQRRIAEVLDRADALRVKRRTIGVVHDSLISSVFTEMFGDSRVNTRGWMRRSLATLVASGDRVNYGVVQPGEHIPDGVPLIRVGDLVGGGVDRSDIKRIDPRIDAAYSRSRLRGTEVLVSCVGTIGLVALAGPADAGSNIARAIARIRLGPEAKREYIASYLRQPAVQHYFMRELRTVTQPTLNIKQIAQTPILLPPLEMQREYSEVVTAHSSSRAASATQGVRLDLLFHSLQQRAFTGQL